MVRFALFVIILQMIFANAYSEDKIVVAISATPNNLNPFFSTDANSQNIGKLLHQSLIDFNASMIPSCQACKSFAIKIRDGKQIIKFQLRDDLTFTDGTKVEPADVKKSWEYFAKDEKIKSTFMGMFETIESVNLLDKRYIEFVFKNFSLENLSNLALLKIVKINKPNRAGLEPEDIMGCGDYVLQKAQTLEVVLKSRDFKKPNLVFKVVKDETTLALKLINKEVDLSVANMSPRKVSWLKSYNKIIQTWEIPSGNYLFMGLNHKREIFKDIRVRRAISLLIPRDEILKYKLKNTAALSNGMFSSAFSEMHQEFSVDKFDPILAQKLLEEAGYGKSGKVLELDWKVSNNKASIEIADVIQYYLEKAGIVVNLSVQEWGTYMSSFKAGKFDVVVGQWIGFTGPNMLNFVYHSENIPPKGGNRTSYNNKEVDNLLDRATQEADGEKRTALYKKADQIISRDYAAISLWHPNIIWIGSTCLKNVELVPTGSFDSLPKVEKNCDK